MDGWVVVPVLSRVKKTFHVRCTKDSVDELRLQLSVFFSICYIFTYSHPLKTILK